MNEVPRRTELLDIVCKDMKTYGFTFIGTITVYSFLQAIGVVNDHIVSCLRYSELLGGMDALD
ncbi:DNA-3-methyladenine glycosylase I [Veillonella montpellierensis]|uniref:DNA-3-methyladenine glycosylase I n=1 Tax=Veillonella montpellierensis TaxID=187328 RepID=UPI0023F85A6E|nr:DNA-3-methyladenine glycosylase I [Veillonella montpellierensis]